MVTLTKGFWLGKYPITQEQWTERVGVNPSEKGRYGGGYPLDSVSWTEAMEFCRKLTEEERAAGRLQSGYAYTLPTEAQWEYACRAGTYSALNNGKEQSATEGQCRNLDEVAWYSSNSGSSTHPVGQKQANGWGLYDMHGNVCEWCLDWWTGGYASSAVTDPNGPGSGTYRVLRGGGWCYDARRCRSANRRGFVPGFRDNGLGFRLALSSVQ